MDGKIVVLLIEDNAADRQLMTEEISDAGIALQLAWVESAEDGLAYLRRTDRYSAAPRPDLVLLDLGLPGMDGQQFLLELGGDPELRNVPVVVLTGRDEDAVVRDAISAGARDFVTKPLTADHFTALLRHVTEYA